MTLRIISFLAALFSLAVTAAAQLQDRIYLSATNAVLEFQSGTYHLWEHVRVESPGVLNLTCDDLRAALPQEAGGTASASAGSGKLRSLVATGNVAIEFYQPAADGSTNVVRAFGGKAEYGSADEVLTLTGNPRIETGTGVMVGTDALIYDLKTRSMKNRGPYRIELKATVLKDSVLFTRGTNSPKPR